MSNISLEGTLVDNQIVEDNGEITGFHLYFEGRNKPVVVSFSNNTNTTLLFRNVVSGKIKGASVSLLGYAIDRLSETPAGMKFLQDNRFVTEVVVDAPMDLDVLGGQRVCPDPKRVLSTLFGEVVRTKIDYEASIMNLLKRGPITVHEIAAILAKSPSEINTMIRNMESQGLFTVDRVQYLIARDFSQPT